MGYLRKSILEIHDALLNNLVTPNELVREALNKAHKDTNNAFEFICDDFAYSQIIELDKKDKNNPLWGIPFTIKDNFSTKGIPTCASSNILENYVPIFNSEVVERLMNAGAILIGKTTLDEFGMGGHGKSCHKGFVFNPWDVSHKREIGGSSSGSAATVAAGIVPFAIGSDTGDSVRKPASYSCLVGFKPSWGRISRYGLFPFAQSLDHVAFFTRNVLDSSIILNAISGHDEKDPTTINNDLIIENIDSSVKNKKFCIIKEIYESMPKNDVVNSFDVLVNKLKEAGSAVEFVSLDKEICKIIYPTYFVISSAEATSNLGCLDGIKFGKRYDSDDYFESVLKTRSEGFGHEIKERLIIGSYSLLKENRDAIYLKAQKCRRIISDRVDEILASYDAIILPTSPDIAPEFDEKNVNTVESNIVHNYLAIANFAGLPSLTVPIGFSKGMPFGVNITGKLFNEKEVLDIAQAIENIVGIKDLSAK